LVILRRFTESASILVPCWTPSRSWAAAISAVDLGSTAADAIDEFHGLVAANGRSIALTNLESTGAARTTGAAGLTGLVAVVVVLVVLVVVLVSPDFFGEISRAAVTVSWVDVELEWPDPPQPASAALQTARTASEPGMRPASRQSVPARPAGRHAHDRRWVRAAGCRTCRAPVNWSPSGVNAPVTCSPAASTAPVRVFPG
jgi:hypothetical protein